MSGKLRVKVQVEGMEALQRKLGRLPDAVGNPVLREAVGAAAELVRKDAAERAPRGATGKLQGGMIAVSMEGSSDRAAFRIGPSAEAWYGGFVEKGTKHSAAKPFLRPALDSKRKAVVQTVRARLAAALLREGRK